MRNPTAIAFLLIAASVSTVAWAQDNSASSDSGQEAAGQEAPAFDAEPLLNSMIALRSTALTCEPYVGGSPVERTAGIVAYFETLNQQLPDLSETETQASLNRFIGSQAAMLCSTMLDEAFEAYHAQAQTYEDNRPEAWPAAPAAPKGAWCAANYCLDQ